MRRYYRTLVFILILVTLAALSLGFQTFSLGNFERGDDTPLGLKLGLDLQGGSHLVYEAFLREEETDEMTGEIRNPSADQMQSLKRTIERRVSSGGLGEPTIQVLGSNRLLVQLPGVGDPERARILIGETAQLEFKHRKLNVALDIPDLTVDDILSVKIITIKTIGHL